MKPEDAKTIGVLGFGTMGHTWAAALLTGDLEIHVFEKDKETIDKNRGRIGKYLKRLVEKGKWSGDIDATMARLHFVDTEQGLVKAGIDVLLEVIFEDLALKCETFKRFGETLHKDTIIWSNTSCLDVEKMAEASGRPDRFIGTHGMNPVHLMVGVEIVRHPQLSDDVLEFTVGMMKRINKEPFLTDNVPGFIVNNGLIPWMIHYYHMLERGQATTVDIDTALKTSLGHPQGVLMLHDYVGTNTMVLVSEELYKATLDPRYKLPQFIYDMNEAGHQGFASGRGFYDWSEPKDPKPVPFAELARKE